MAPLSDDALARRAADLEWLLTDVDGVLTDGTLLYGPDGELMKPFQVKDGLGFKLAQDGGLKVGILSARSSPGLDRRAGELGLDAVLVGEEDKGAAFQGFLRQHATSPRQVAYIGDDLPDLPVLRRCALSFAPADAAPEVRGRVHRALASPGGGGALREAVELLLRARGTWEEVLARYAGGD